MVDRIAKPVQEGNVIDYTATADIAVGDIVVLGKVCGVAMTDILNGAVGAVTLTGVWDVPAVSGAAFVIGDLIYWNATNKQATKTATDNAVLGMLVAPKASGSTVARVKIGAFPTA